MNTKSIAFADFTQPVNAARCPLCGQANQCQLCTGDAYKGSCWCLSLSIPDELLARVPAEQRNRACLCAGCVKAFHRERASEPQAAVPGDYYFDDAGWMVFTAAYHLRRGYCCHNDCRHCPYPKPR
ncbi:MAG: cysteine-rich CWC family protein [Verrucomicrobiota bacterium]